MTKNDKLFRQFSILDVRLGSEYISASSFLRTFYILFMKEIS